MLQASCLTGRLSRRGQHILQEDTVSLRRVCHQHMSHSSHQPSVLQNGAAAHPLHDASSGLQQLRVRHPQQQIPAVPAPGVHPQDLHLIGTGIAAGNGT